MELVVDIKVSLREVLSRLDRITRLEKLRNPAEDALARLLTLFRKVTPVDTDINQRNPGKLRAGWQGEVRIRSTNYLSMPIYNVDPRMAKVWPTLLQGTRAHIIRSRPGSALHFRFRSGDYFLGQLVRHPGAVKSINIDSLNRDLKAEIRLFKERLTKALVKDA